MAYNYVLLRSAQMEFVEIVQYLTEVLKSPQAARNFIDEFDRQIARVCDNPQIYGLSRMSELAVRGYRTFFVNKYIVLYKVDNMQVVVAHIFHQTQNYASLV